MTKTSKFSQQFLKFLSFLFVIEKPGLSIDQVVAVIDSMQPGAKYFEWF
jgi:hypothetical protein